MSIESTIKKYIIDNFIFDHNNNLNDNDSFLEKGIIDSTGVLEIVSFLEETFQIKVFDEELIPENLDSIDHLVIYVKNKQSTVNATPANNVPQVQTTI